MKKFINLSYEERKAMGEYAREFVCKNFNKKDVVNTTINEIWVK